METLIREMDIKNVWAALENVKDPEIPVLSVIDMGIITDIKLQTPNSKLQICSITITPTFVGCPAIEVIKKSIYDEVKKIGFDEVEVKVDYETHWTSDRMSEAAK